METSTPPPELQAPGLQGILARTLSPSPCTRWILPAKIRSPAKNDIVFVGDSSVHLREFFVEGTPHLAETLCSINFDTQILAADIISATSQIVDSDEQIINQTVEHVRFSINGRPVKDDEPAQILVLSTSKSELIFLYAREDTDGTVRFVHGVRPMFSGVGLQDQQGLHLAHDPESRALAVAPNRDLCVICSLRPLDQVKTEVDRWRPAKEHLKPFREQRYIQVDGNIVRMDFLQPPRDDKDKVILVLIVAKQGCAYMVLYRWDANSPLHRIKPMRSSGQELPEEDKMPLMLIPCNAPASFLLVTETELVLYNRVTHSEAQRTAHDLSDRHEFKDGRRTKMWTQWAKPRRTELFRKKNDEIMLVREDGTLRSYDIDVHLDLQVKAHWSAGNLGISIDTAFCTLPAPLDTLQGGDIVIAGGSITAGGVFHFQSRTQPRLLQPIPNGTPSNDLLLLPPSSSREVRIDRRSRIFTCCGSHQGGGGLAEIQHGLEAEIGWVMDDPDLASLLHLWSVEDRENGRILLFSSYPLHSALLTLDISTSELEAPSPDQYSGIDLDVPSLSLAVIDEDTLVQITTSSMNMISLGKRGPPTFHSFAGLSPLCADIDVRTGTVIVAHQMDRGFIVSVCSVRSSTGLSPSENGHNVPLEHRPSCLCISSLGNELLAAIANEQGEVAMFKIETGNKIAIGSPCILPIISSQQRDTSIGSMCLLSRPGLAAGLLLCGLRNGSLVCVEILRDDHQGGQYRTKIISRSRPARASVSVCPDEFSRQGGHVTAAFVTHGSTLERVSLKPNGAGAEYEQSFVIVHSRNDPSRSSENINAVSRIPHLSSVGGHSTEGLLLCATASDISFSSLASQSKAVARHVPVVGVPYKVIHSNFLKSMIIGVNPAPGVAPQSTATFPKLCFAPVSNDDATCTAIDESKTIVLGETGEKISALTHYSPTDGRHHFEMVLIAVQSATRIEPGKLKISSRILCVSDKHVLRGAATPRVVMRLPGKRVTALCPIGKAGLLIGSNNEILLHTLNVGSKKWSTLTRHALPSPARQIRVQGSLIYVATEKHSLLILKEHNNTLSIQSSDSQARTVSSVLPIHRHNIVIADNTAQGTQLSGIIEDHQGSTLQRSFEVRVPHLLERLEQDRTDSKRNTFIANSLDGTLYSFSSLNMNEWLLCYFLQGLTKHNMKVGAKRIGEELDLTLWTGSKKVKVPPSFMGINGDLLARMLQPGAYHLRTLLQPAIKLEPGILSSAPRPQVDDQRACMDTLKKLLSRCTDHISEEDVVGSTLIWLRGLLR